jgi:hypothetical protein
MEPQLVPYLIRDSHIVHNRRKHIGFLCDPEASGLCFYVSMWFKIYYWLLHPDSHFHLNIANYRLKKQQATAECR